MSTDRAIASLIRKLDRAFPRTERVQRTPMDEFVLSFLLWEGISQRAEHALKRLLDGSLDLNELRVTRPDDLASIIGKTYPLAEERAERLHLALNDLYKREHAVSLDRVIAMTKRDGRKYIEELDGMVPYVAARISLFALDTHAVPIDDRTLRLLIEHEVVEPAATLDKAVGKLERHIKSTDAVQAHFLLQQWAENDGVIPRARKPRATRSASARTKRKPSRRKTPAK